MLRRFGFQFTGRGYIRNQRDVNKDRVVAALFVAHLANRLHKRQRLDIADRSADLDDQHVRLVLSGHGPHRLFDLVRDMRDHLDRLAEIIAAALLFDHRKIYPPARPVVRLRKLRIGEALVMPEIEIGFRAVVGHKDLAMLKGRHRSRIDVDIRIELHHLHLHPARLEQAADQLAASPFPKLETTPPVTKIYLVIMFVR